MTSPLAAVPATGSPAVPAAYWPGRRLVIAHFSNSSVRGGAEEHLLTILRGLDRNWFEAALLCTPELAERIGTDLPAGVELVRLTLSRPWQAAAAARLLAWLRRRRPDIVHSHLVCASLFASPLARLAGVPVIVETHHGREAWRKGRRQSHFFVDRLVGRAVDHYIAVSSANAAYLRHAKGLPAEKIAIIPNGCDCERIARLPAPAAWRARFEIAPTAPVAVVVGRLEPQKGHATLLAAWPTVLQRFPEARLLVVGDGSLAAELRAHARSLRIELAVRFVGFQADVRPFWAMATISVLPSLYEVMPLVAMESLAAGVPMVATAVDGTPEVVRHERTGLLVPPSDSAALAAAIGRLLADGNLRLRLARRGREWARCRFDRRRQIAATEQLYLAAWQATRGRRHGASRRGTESAP